MEDKSDNNGAAQNLSALFAQKREKLAQQRDALLGNNTFKKVGLVAAALGEDVAQKLNLVHTKAYVLERDGLSFTYTEEPAKNLNRSDILVQLRVSDGDKTVLAARALHSSFNDFTETGFVLDQYSPGAWEKTLDALAAEGKAVVAALDKQYQAPRP